MLGNTVIVGASGRLGRALLDRSDPSTTLAAARNGDAGAGRAIVGEDGLAESASLAGKSSLINCAALSKGSEAELQRANAALAETLAIQARRAGIGHFIQVSSLRVYGRAEQIGSQTPLAPDSAYGRSKLDAEQRVTALQTEAFQVSCIRLPFLFGANAPSMLAQLVRLLARTRTMPIPRKSPARSMLGFDDAAFAIERVVAQRRTGIVHAADPTPFTFELLAEAMQREAGLRLLLPKLPDWLAGLAGRLVPRLRDSLYSSEILKTDINFLADKALPTGLETELARLVRRCCRRTP